MKKSSDTFPDPYDEFAHLLPGEVFQTILGRLRSALPGPLTDDPAAMARRDRAAIGVVAMLQPKNAIEAQMAGQYVAAAAWSLECLRLAREPGVDPKRANKHLSQALGMRRESESALRMLLRMQVAREKIESNEVTANRAARLEERVGRMLEKGLDPVAPRQDAASPPVAAPQKGEENGKLDASPTAPARAGHDPAGGKKVMGVRGRRIRLVSDDEANSQEAISETTTRFRPRRPWLDS